MNQRDRLIELIIKSVDGCACYCAKTIADYLLNNDVIVPPCKVGDKVYLPRTTDWGDVLSYEVIEVGVDRDGLFFVIDDEDQEHILIDEIGEEVFLTKEEAEKALEEMK